MRREAHDRKAIGIFGKDGKAALDNPDLPTEFVKELLISRAEGQKVAKPFLPAGASPLTATPYTESV